MEQPHHSQPFPSFYHPSSLSLSSSFKYDDVDSETTSSPDHQYMFEKPLTPSDVGKLNRLVIPKQHAEKYFPLAASATGASGGGLLLGFEDESGKCWKFRYSYWNSSQSYVLTKGWSRYVKEKKLDAGDVVLFQRHRCEPDRLFIGWRRRGSPSAHHHQPNPVQHQISSFPSYRPDNCLHAAGKKVRQEGGQKERKSGGGNSKRVRLFGVNLECQIQEEEGEVVIEEEEEIEMSDGSSLSSQGQGPTHHAVGSTAYNYFDYRGSYPSNHHYNSHMDINFPQDVNQMRNRLR